MIDWQTIAVALIILAALIYTLRRGWLKLRGFRSKRAGEAACATGCGSCGSEKKPKTATPRTVFGEISRSRSTPRH
jgi:hypothetical protein